MIKSMTAYARSDFTAPALSIAVEIRGYNSRHLDTALKLYHRYALLEDKIKKTLSRAVTRGRVEIRVSITETVENQQLFTINAPMADAYYETLSALKNRLHLTADISLELLATRSGIIDTADPEVNTDAIWPHLETCLNTALADFDAMKKTEGTALEADLKERLAFIESRIDEIESRADGLLPVYQEKLKNRITALTQGMVEIDPARIAQEAAFLADKSDISEELVRARSHLMQFRAMMKEAASCGRSLNFLIQEFNREFNTMGSKAADADIVHVIVAAKTELEKIREQIQNIE